MRIKFNHDGGETWVNSPELALLYWYMAQLPPMSIEKPKMFHAYTRGPLPQGQELLDLSIAACERKYQKTPEVFGNSYEEHCLSIMLWLVENGYVTDWDMDLGPNSKRDTEDEQYKIQELQRVKDLWAYLKRRRQDAITRANSPSNT